MATYRELDGRLTPEQQALKQQVHEFAKSVLRPTAVALDRLSDPQQVVDRSSALWTALRAAYSQGIHTALITTVHGGMGLSGVSLHLALEELGWGSSDFAAALAVAGFPFAMIAATGNTALIEEWVKPFVADKDAHYVGCWAITEPDHGSDTFMASTPQFFDPTISGQVTARAEREDYVINGQKAAWVSNGTIATHALTYLTLDPSKGMAGGGVAFIPLNLPGVSKGKPVDKMGQRALNQGSIHFTNVRIPKRYLLFDTASYEAILNQTLVLTNGAMGAIFTGVARAAYEQALAYTKTRLQGGKLICEHQLVQKHLFDMFTKVETSRALSRAAMAYNATAQPPAATLALHELTPSVTVTVPVGAAPGPGIE